MLTLLGDVFELNTAFIEEDTVFLGVPLAAEVVGEIGVGLEGVAAFVEGVIYEGLFEDLWRGLRLGRWWKYRFRMGDVRLSFYL